MSRLIVKNLPKNITEQKIKSIFSEKGVVTDVQLKYTKDGTFRQFCFVGYQNEEQALSASTHFDKSCIQTNRISVEVCATLGSESKPKAWSKYAPESSAFKKIHGLDVKEAEEKERRKAEKIDNKKRNEKHKIDDIIGEHKADPKFIEFMEAHTKGNGVWDNDAGLPVEEVETVVEEKPKPKKAAEKSIQNRPVCDLTKKKKKIKNETKSSNGSEVKEEADDEAEAEAEAETETFDKVEEDTPVKQQISDLEYMESLKKKSDVPQKRERMQKKPKEFLILFTAKVTGLPYTAKRQDVIKFLRPLKPHSIRVPLKGQRVCFIGFKDERDLKKMLLKDKSFLQGKQVHVVDFTKQDRMARKQNEVEEKKPKKNARWEKQEEALKQEEDISESGCIYFRNLSYTVTEKSLQELFEKYGPIAEISLPVDTISRQIKGFGTVTFMMPEHAMRAFNELDGTAFAGRMLHLLPGKTTPKPDPAEMQGLTFKEQKALKLKRSAGQSVNWNTLFLGANAVADLMAQNYETRKEDILDSSAGGSSAAVRLALGETEIVMNVQRFLEENDVMLEAFTGIPKKRSNTIMLAKNLPANTQVSELQPLFGRFGLLGRVVLPPSGVTAIIEFMDAFEAKKAYKGMAYTKFKDLPLFLEWAPDNIFKDAGTPFKSTNGKTPNDKDSVNESKNPVPTQSTETIESASAIDNDNADSDLMPEPDTTIFLRNLNFITREAAIREHFKAAGSIHMVQVAMKKDSENPKMRSSLGYGFIQFKHRATLDKVLRTMQFVTIDGNRVELKKSDRITKSEVSSARKPTATTPQTGTKIMVRNIPFQANESEIREIFKAFGELRAVRLPKKMTPGSESHRGFGFIDYYTKSEAKKAFTALSQSTHLYGRRLVLEWAAAEEDVEQIRKRTADQFLSGGPVSKQIKSVFDSSEVEKIIAKDNNEEEGDEDEYVYEE